MLLKFKFEYAPKQMQVESLKYDVREKTDLLSEASAAIEQLERLAAAAAAEREEERERLEDRLRQMEEDIGESNFLVRINISPKKTRTIGPNVGEIAGCRPAHFPTAILCGGRGR